ncbi:MAG: hypothetical protein WBB74_07735 [Gaiellaceae bacterium]
MLSGFDQTRREWEEGHGRFEEAARDPARTETLLAELEAVTAELRRRIGQNFTLRELVTLYGGAERWTREAVAEGRAGPGWPGRLAIVTDAAFHRYSRGAVDYRP